MTDADINFIGNVEGRDIFAGALMWWFVMDLWEILF